MSQKSTTHGAKTAFLQTIETYLPAWIETNDDLDREKPEWQIHKVAAKTSICQRHRAGKDEWTSDLACAAVKKLLEKEPDIQSRIDFILCCTQTPDYLLPSIACQIQDKCQLPQAAGALDINLGCSGYVYCLSLARGLIESGQASNILVVTADTYTKLVNPNDRNTRCIFGDAATASLLVAQPIKAAFALGPFEFGTDGSGSTNLAASGSGVRGQSNSNCLQSLFMDGPEIFAFTLGAVPKCVDQLLQKTHLNVRDIDLFVPHQANAHMLEHLRELMDIPNHKFLINMQRVGNTVSSSIPLALAEAGFPQLSGSPKRILLIGFGVGYSWAGGILSC